MSWLAALPAAFRAERAMPRSILENRREAACLVLTIALAFGCAAAAQDKEQAASFDLLALPLTALIAAGACGDLVLDHEALNRFLSEKGISASQLSAKGPLGGEVARFRGKLRRRFQRHNQEACDLALALLGPEGTALRGVLRKP